MTSMENDEMTDGQHHRDPPDVNVNEHGICSKCSRPAAGEVVVCMICNFKFHAICTGVEQTICTATFLGDFTKVVNKAGAYKGRPGNFRFVCDPCLTNFELKKSAQVQCEVTNLESRVQGQVNNLESKVGSLASDITEIKNMLKASSNDNNNSRTTAINDTSPWGDSTRVVIMKNTLSGSPNLKALEKHVVDNNINVSATYENKKGNTVIVCKTKQDGNAIQQEVKKILPGFTVKTPVERRSVISVVGFRADHDAKAVEKMITDNNYFLSKSATVDNFSVYKVKPCLNNPAVYQAMIKVTDGIRQAIVNNGNRIIVGLYNCQVYDQHPVKRCFKCQGYGHFKADCTEVFSCGKCGESHDTLNCTSTTKIECVNCKRDNEHDITSHNALSTSCPCFVKAREKAKIAKEKHDQRQTALNC